MKRRRRKPKKLTLDRALSILRKDKAVRRVDAAAKESWKMAANEAFIVAAYEHETFTTDLVWVYLDEWEIPRPREPRAMSPRVTAMVNANIIAPTGRFARSDRPEAHRNPKEVYRSLVYGDERIPA